jgi:hypothetical protein
MTLSDDKVQVSSPKTSLCSWQRCWWCFLGPKNFYDKYLMNSCNGIWNLGHSIQSNIGTYVLLILNLEKGKPVALIIWILFTHTTNVTHLSSTTCIIPFLIWELRCRQWTVHPFLSIKFLSLTTRWHTHLIRAWFGSHKRHARSSPP